MKDVRNIEGVPDPRQAGALNKDGEIDSEKFKKIMKIDPSDESEQKKKRNRTKQQEEEEEPIETTANAPPQTVFSDFLTDTQPTTSILTPGQGSKPTLTASADTPPPTPSPINAYQDSRVKSQAVSDHDMLIVTVPSDSKPLLENDSSNQKLISPEKSDDQPIRQNSKAQKSETLKKEKASVKSEMVTKEQLKKEIDSLPKDAKISTEDLKKPSKSKKSEKSENLTTTEEEKGKATSLESLPLPEVVEKKPSSSTSQPDDVLKVKPTTGTERKESKQKDKEREEKAPTETNQVQPNTAQASSISEIESVGRSPFSQLSKEVFELFERMVGLMTIEKDKDHTITTVKINMPNSVFHNCKIVLEQYKSARTSFTLTLEGSPKAVEKFAANIASLSNAFTQSKMSFDVTIRSPVLLEEFRYLRKKKGIVTELNEKGRDKSDS